MIIINLVDKNFSNQQDNEVYAEELSTIWHFTDFGDGDPYGVPSKAQYEAATRFHIDDKAGFMAFKQTVENGYSFQSKEVNLRCDIDLAGEKWTPIGCETWDYYYSNVPNPFKGKFNGNNFSILNMETKLGTGSWTYPNSYGTDAAGLFMCVGGDTWTESSGAGFSSTQYPGVMNLRIVNPKFIIYDDSLYTHVMGTVAAHVEGSAKLYNIQVDEPTIEINDRLTVSGTFSHSHVLYAGGVVGYTSFRDNLDLTIENCEVRDINYNFNKAGWGADLDDVIYIKTAYLSGIGPVYCDDSPVYTNRKISIRSCVVKNGATQNFGGADICNKYDFGGSFLEDITDYSVENCYKQSNLGIDGYSGLGDTSYSLYTTNIVPNLEKSGSWFYWGLIYNNKAIDNNGYPTLISFIEDQKIYRFGSTTTSNGSIDISYNPDFDLGSSKEAKDWFGGTSKRRTIRVPNAYMLSYTEDNPEINIGPFIVTATPIVGYKFIKWTPTQDTSGSMLRYTLTPVYGPEEFELTFTTVCDDDPTKAGSVTYTVAYNTSLENLTNNENEFSCNFETYDAETNTYTGNVNFECIPGTGWEISEVTGISNPIIAATEITLNVKKKRFSIGWEESDPDGGEWSSWESSTASGASSLAQTQASSPDITYGAEMGYVISETSAVITLGDYKKTYNVNTAEGYKLEYVEILDTEDKVLYKCVPDESGTIRITQNIKIKVYTIKWYEITFADPVNEEGQTKPVDKTFYNPVTDSKIKIRNGESIEGSFNATSKKLTYTYIDRDGDEKDVAVYTLPRFYVINEDEESHVDNVIGINESKISADANYTTIQPILTFYACVVTMQNNSKSNGVLLADMTINGDDYETQNDGIFAVDFNSSVSVSNPSDGKYIYFFDNGESVVYSIKDPVKYELSDYGFGNNSSSFTFNEGAAKTISPIIKVKDYTLTINVIKDGSENTTETTIYYGDIIGYEADLSLSNAEGFTCKHTTDYIQFSDISIKYAGYFLESFTINGTTKDTDGETFEGNITVKENITIDLVFNKLYTVKMQNSETEKAKMTVDEEELANHDFVVKSGTIVNVTNNQINKDSATLEQYVYTFTYKGETVKTVTYTTTEPKYEIDHYGLSSNNAVETSYKFVENITEKTIAPTFKVKTFTLTFNNEWGVNPDVDENLTISDLEYGYQLKFGYNLSNDVEQSVIFHYNGGVKNFDNTTKNGQIEYQYAGVYVGFANGTHKLYMLEDYPSGTITITESGSENLIIKPIFEKWNTITFDDAISNIAGVTMDCSCSVEYYDTYEGFEFTKDASENIGNVIRVKNCFDTTKLAFRYFTIEQVESNDEQGSSKFVVKNTSGKKYFTAYYHYDRADKSAFFFRVTKLYAEVTNILEDQNVQPELTESRITLKITNELTDYVTFKDLWSGSESATPGAFWSYPKDEEKANGKLITEYVTANDNMSGTKSLQVDIYAGTIVYIEEYKNSEGFTVYEYTFHNTSFNFFSLRFTVKDNDIILYNSGLPGDEGTQTGTYKVDRYTFKQEEENTTIQINPKFTIKQYSINIDEHYGEETYGSDLTDKAGKRVFSLDKGSKFSLYVDDVSKTSYYINVSNSFNVEKNRLNYFTVRQQYRQIYDQIAYITINGKAYLPSEFSPSNPFVVESVDQSYDIHIYYVETFDLEFIDTKDGTLIEGLAKEVEMIGSVSNPCGMNSMQEIVFEYDKTVFEIDGKSCRSYVFSLKISKATTLDPDKDLIQPIARYYIFSGYRIPESLTINDLKVEELSNGVLTKVIVTPVFEYSVCEAEFKNSYTEKATMKVKTSEDSEFKDATSQVFELEFGTIITFTKDESAEAYVYTYVITFEDKEIATIVYTITDNLYSMQYELNADGERIKLLNGLDGEFSHEIAPETDADGRIIDPPIGYKQYAGTVG